MRITVNLRHIWPIFFQELKERPDCISYKRNLAMKTYKFILTSQ